MGEGAVGASAEARTPPDAHDFGAAHKLGWHERKHAGGALSSDETVRLAIATMQAVLSSDFKASEIEVSLVRAGERVRVLAEAEVDAHLTVLAERD